MRSPWNKKMPPGVNRAASTAQKLRGLHLGRRKRVEMRTSRRAPVERRASAVVIGWSSYATTHHERNAHGRQRNPERTRIAGMRDGRELGHHHRNHFRNQRPTAAINEPVRWPRRGKNELRPERLARPSNALIAENRGTESPLCRCKRSSSANSDLQRAFRSEKSRHDSLALISSGLLYGLGLGAIAGWRGAEYVGAQVVPGDRAVGNTFDGAAMLGWNTPNSCLPLAQQRIWHLQRGCDIFCHDFRLR